MVVTVPVTVGGCSGRADESAQRTPPSAAAAAVSATDVTPYPPSAAMISCDAVTTEVEMPVIQPQADGVHFVIRTPTSSRLSFLLGDGREWLHVQDVRGGETDVVRPLPTGSVTVACGGADTPPPDSGKRLRILDVNGLWVNPGSTPDCDGFAGSFPLYGADAHGDAGPPADAARRVFEAAGLPGDVVQAGYPESAEPEYVLEVDGRWRASIDLSRTPNGRWTVQRLTMCADSPMP